MAASDSVDVVTRGEGRIMVGALSSVLGGGITVAQNLVSQMADLRRDLHFALYCSHQEVASFRYPENVEVVHLPALLSRRARWRWEQMAMPAVVEARRFDVVLALGGYLSFRTKAPQVAVWQNPNVFSPPGISRPASEKVLIALQRRAQLASMKRAAQNVFLTQNSVELAARWWNMQEIRHCVIHSGIDLDPHVSKNPRPLDQREHFAVAVGHTYSHKNYEAMVDAIDEYRRRFDPPLRLRIVGGPANPQYFEAIKQRIADRGLGDIVEMAGPAPSEEVISLMSRASVYLVTSLLETFGLTMFEAMGSGLPVVASRATCHPEVCGDAALYCDPRDPTDIAEKLHEVISTPQLGENLRERGLQRLKAFSWTRSAQAYIDVLESVSRDSGRSTVAAEA